MNNVICGDFCSDVKNLTHRKGNCLKSFRRLCLVHVETLSLTEMLSGLTLGGICIKDHDYHDTIEKFYYCCHQSAIIVGQKNYQVP